GHDVTLATLDSNDAFLIVGCGWGIIIQSATDLVLDVVFATGLLAVLIDGLASKLFAETGAGDGVFIYTNLQRQLDEGKQSCTPLLIFTERPIGAWLVHQQHHGQVAWKFWSIVTPRSSRSSPFPFVIFPFERVEQIVDVRQRISPVYHQAGDGDEALGSTIQFK